MRGIRARVGGAALTWVLVLTVVAVAVHPERCPRASADAARSAAESAVTWFGANVNEAGRFLYRYDRERATPEPGYNETRHSGVLWALYQAESAGIDGAAAIAEQGMGFVDDRLRASTFGTVFGAGEEVATGAVALLVAALAERRHVTGLDDRDELIRDLGTTLVAAVTPDGAVDAVINVRSGPVAGTRSPFFTGEVLWALSRLELLFPDVGFGDAARMVRRYLIRDRDEIERPFPQVSDHWAAYAWEVMSRWPDPPAVDDEARTWLDRQLGLFGVQVRYESQRVGGITSLTRGTHALGAGVGTLGEGIGNYLIFDSVQPVLSEADREDLIQRATCTAGLLIERQVGRDEAVDDAEPEAVVGAWFRRGDTQMDDQQHALSALLLLETVLTP